VSFWGLRKRRRILKLKKKNVSVVTIDSIGCRRERGAAERGRREGHD